MRRLLAIENLSVGFPAGGSAGRQVTGRGVTVLRRLCLEVRTGECLGLVGESGCGKSLTALAVLGLLPPGGRYLGGRVFFDGAGDLLALPADERRRSRGRGIAMIFQEPASALNPVLTIGFQIREVLRLHRALAGRAARRAALALLEQVAMPDPARRLESYPHELSGGQMQRAMIALALAAEPRLLLADEPTTALDVTVQAQILELLGQLRRELDLTVLLISHDLGVVAQCCDRLAVMYAGQIVEEAPVEALYSRPAHPYSQALLAAVPRVGESRPDGGIPGRVPELGDRPEGCSFHPRCPAVFAPCRRQAPALEDLGDGQRARCFLHRAEGRGEGS